MDEKMIRISGELHRRVKTVAAMYNMTIREFTERALKKYIPPTLEARMLNDPPEDEASSVA